MRKLTPLLIGSFLLAAACGAAVAEPSRHKLRLGFTLATSTADFTTRNVSEGFFTTSTATTVGHGGSSIGFRLGYEFRPIPRLGVSLDLESITVDIRYSERIDTETFNFFGKPFFDTITGFPEGELQFTPITLGLNVYLSSGERHEFYVGPALGYVLYDSLKQDGWRGIVASSGDSIFVEGDSSIELDDDTSIGAVAGLDLKLANVAGSFHVSVGYLAASADGSDPETGFTMDVDPIFARMGVVFRF